MLIQAKTSDLLLQTISSVVQLGTALLRLSGASPLRSPPAGLRRERAPAAATQRRRRPHELPAQPHCEPCRPRRPPRTARCPRPAAALGTPRDAPRRARARAPAPVGSSNANSAHAYPSCSCRTSPMVAAVVLPLVVLTSGSPEYS